MLAAQDHMRGRRHARRLQYLKHMPEQERSKHIERIASGGCRTPPFPSFLLSCPAALRCVEQTVEASCTFLPAPPICPCHAWYT